MLAPFLARGDVGLLFLTRAIRMMAYGSLSVVLALYLSEVGLSPRAIGLLFTMTLIGDTAISLWITTHADRLGRKPMLMVGAVLMMLGGLVFTITDDFAFLLLGATIGVLSPSGNEVGPFLAIEQASLAHAVPAHQRTGIFAWYQVVGSAAAAIGSLGAGALVSWLGQAQVAPIPSYRTILFAYAVAGLVLAGLFSRLTTHVESNPSPEPAAAPLRFGLHRSRAVVFRLSGLFALDSFGGGFVLQSVVALWFNRRFGADVATLGAIFFAANLLAGLSALVAARIARRIGLVRTMVFTHVPSNLLLVLVPFMPTLSSAVLVLLIRFSISQMDVPARQSYVSAVVSPDERSAAAGITGVARTVGAAMAPAAAGLLIGSASLAGGIFVTAGVLKLVYDGLLFLWFRDFRPSEEIA